MSIPVFGKAAFLSSIHKCPNDRFCVKGEKGLMLHKMEHSIHLTSAKERKQSRLIYFAKSIILSCSVACFLLCIPLTLPPAAVLPLNYSWETTHLSIFFSFLIANGLSIPLCPTVKPFNSIKLLKVIFSRSGSAVRDWQRWLTVSIVMRRTTLSKPR